MAQFGPHAVNLRRRIILAGACVLAFAATLLSAPAAANAATSLQGILCGGTYKYGLFQSYPSGGYVGEGCDPGIDWVSTPTDNEEDYEFGPTDGGTYNFNAWIPSTHATAVMNYDLYASSRASLLIVWV
jgi:hypothetical protein